MKIRVKNCISPSDGAVRFQAEVGDLVLLSHRKGSYFEASILSIKSEDEVLVTFLDGANEVERYIPSSEIKALLAHPIS